MKYEFQAVLSLQVFSLGTLCFALVVISEAVVAPHATLLGDHISLIRAFTCGANNLSFFPAAFDAAKARRAVLCLHCNDRMAARAREERSQNFP